jgi:hypothetical protein
MAWSSSSESWLSLRRRITMDDGSPWKRFRVGLDACLDLFLKGKSASQGTTNASKVAIEYLFHDCSIGMHYSLEAKHTAASVR